MTMNSLRLSENSVILTSLCEIRSNSIWVGECLVKLGAWPGFAPLTGVGHLCFVMWIMTDGRIFLLPMEYTAGLMIWITSIF